MELQKLSANVNQKANRSVRRIITGLCALAGCIILVVILSYTVRDNSDSVQLYRSEIDNVLSEKMTFINTIAEGTSFGESDETYYSYVDSMAALYDDVSAVYIVVEKEGVVFPDGYMTYMSGGWLPEADFVVSERDWFLGAEGTDDVYISEPYVDKQSGNICITLSRAINHDGQFVGVAGLDMYMSDLMTLMEASYDGGDYVFLTTGDGTILTHPDDELALGVDGGSSIDDALGGTYRSVCEQTLATRLIWDYRGGLKFAVCDRAETTGWNVVAVISLTNVFMVILVTVVLSAVLSVILGGLMKRQLMVGLAPMFEPLEELAANVGRISDGELDYSFLVDEQSQEVHALSVALNRTMKELQQYILKITDTVTAISEKNLDFGVDGNYTGDYEKIKDALVDIMQVLNDSFVRINEQASLVLSYSENLSATSENVAEAATRQSEAVLDASSAMQRLTDNMERIQEFASSIKGNTDHVNESLALSNAQMSELVEAMDEIVACYDEIAGFVTEINAIANQTNLLALNASIEAARAGEKGRGFAVVADEISALSAGSSHSSTKISEVIAHSLDSVERGKALVDRTNKTIADSATYSAGNTQMVDEIVSFVDTQKNSADEISASIRRISEMVENNAASAEENSAISTSLRECAQALTEMIAQFKLRQ